MAIVSTIKKACLSSLVIAIFAIYSLQAKHILTWPVEAPDDGQITPRRSSQATTTSTSSQNTSATTTGSTTYKDGSYTGPSEDAFYGLVQVQAIIQNGKLIEVRMLSYPNDQPNSIEINNQALPILQQEAIKAQSGHIDIVSGATDTSQAFIQSLTSALNSARS